MPQSAANPPLLAPHPILVFDACHVGVVLRTVLFVQAVLAVGLLFIAPSFIGWLEQLALLTSATLPATLGWLVLACSLKRSLQALGSLGQYTVGVLLGALAGLMACWLLRSVGGLPGVNPAPALACAATGVVLAALLVTALELRARLRRPATTHARLAELQARIRPHFLFNTLNSAIALVREEPAQAEALLEDLSDLFRHALLEQGDWATLADEIQLAQRYLAIEQVRFGPRMQVQWQLDPQADNARLPPLLLQPLVENAVKHGVEPSTGTARLRIRTARRGSRVIVRILNTVPAAEADMPPRPSPPGQGMALANVRERLRLLHDVDCEFHAGLHNGLYQVRIALPLR